MPDRCHTWVAAQGRHTRCWLKCLGFVNIQHTLHEKQYKVGKPQNEDYCLTMTSIAYFRGNHIQQFYYFISCTWVIKTIIQENLTHKMPVGECLLYKYVHYVRFNYWLEELNIYCDPWSIHVVMLMPSRRLDCQLRGTTYRRHLKTLSKCYNYRDQARLSMNTTRAWEARILTTPTGLVNDHWRSSHYAAMRVRNKKATINGGHIMLQKWFSIPYGTVLRGKNSLPLGTNIFLRRRSRFTQLT